MLGPTRFLFASLVLTATVSISLSNSHQGNFLSRLLSQGKGYLKTLDKTNASSRSWNVTSATTMTDYASQARSGGWGWKDGGGHGHGHGHGGNDYVYSHSTHGKGGTDLNTLIGGLSLAGLLGVALYAFTRPTTTTIVMSNMSGRRRRSTDDFDEDNILEGETLPEFLSRIGKYLETPWGSGKDTQKIEPFKLY